MRGDASVVLYLPQRRLPMRVGGNPVEAVGSDKHSEDHGMRSASAAEPQSPQNGAADETAAAGAEAGGSPENLTVLVAPTRRALSLASRGNRLAHAVLRDPAFSVSFDEAFAGRRVPPAGQGYRYASRRG